MNGDALDRAGDSPCPEKGTTRHPTSDEVMPHGSPNTETAVPPHDTVGPRMITEMLMFSDVGPLLVQAEFRYRCIDPFAIQLRLSLDQSRAVIWIFSRELLIVGTRCPSGLGDVRVYPGRGGVIIELRSDNDANAVLLAHRTRIEEFLDRTLSIVPIGSEIEHYDVDGGLIRLLHQ